MRPADLFGAPVLLRAERVALLPQLLQIITRELDRLRAGQVLLQELALTYHLRGIQRNTSPIR